MPEVAVALLEVAEAVRLLEVEEGGLRAAREAAQPGPAARRSPARWRHKTR